MKTAIAIVMSAALVIAMGCAGPRGASMPNRQEFTILTPPVITEVRQEETEGLTISLYRREFSNQDVKLEIMVPKGLRVLPPLAWIKAGEKTDVPLRITADRYADLGEYKVYVKGTAYVNGKAEPGEPIWGDFTVTVKPSFPPR